MRGHTFWTAALLLAAACGGGKEDQPADRDAARRAAAADTVQMANEAYDAMGFETIEWPADSVAITRGSIVWASSCMKCHGITGLGDGGWVMRGDTLHPPSFLEADWRFRDDLDGLRRYIFAGNEEGMPHWGLVGLQPRDVDAVARFILQDLRSPGN